MNTPNTVPLRPSLAQRIARSARRARACLRVFSLRQRLGWAEQELLIARDELDRLPAQIVHTMRHAGALRVQLIQAEEAARNG
jgi:hypothetical protein